LYLLSSEFTPEWWAYLMATGFFLACTLGCKMVGLFTFATIGGAVIWDLWGILDIKKGHSMVSSENIRLSLRPRIR
jgi:dolichyl-phosphate-mannose-protein mannosyltransferase